MNQIINKPSIDKRDYKFITLDNKLDVLLIHDKGFLFFSIKTHLFDSPLICDSKKFYEDADKSACAVSTRVGHFSDPVKNNNILFQSKFLFFDSRWIEFVFVG